MKPLLAQRLTEFPFERWCKIEDLDPRDQGVAIIRRSIDALRRPWEGPNHLVLPHRALGPIYAAEAEQQAAAIYHFSADARDAAKAIGDSRRRAERVRSWIRAPGSRCFFEWQNPEPGLEYIALGIYTEGDRDCYRFVFWSDNVHDAPEHRPMPAAWGEYSLDTLEGSITTATAPLTPEAEHARQLIEYEVVKNVCLYWALLGTGGAVVIERTPAPRGSGKAHRSKSAGAAILSFNRVRLTIPQGLITRTNTVDWQRGPGVRRHKVRAHPNFYWAGPKQDRTLIMRWIAAYWRGNARLGLVLTAHEVEARQ